MNEKTLTENNVGDVEKENLRIAMIRKSGTSSGRKYSSDITKDLIERSRISQESFKANSNTNKKLQERGVQKKFDTGEKNDKDKQPREIPVHLETAQFLSFLNALAYQRTNMISEKSPADAQNPQTLIKTVACNVANKDVYGDSAVEGNSAAFTWSSSFAQNSTHRKILGGKGSVASASYRHADFLINSLSTNEKERLLKFSPTSDGIAANATARAPSPNVMPLISEKSPADAQNPQTLIKTVACNVASKDVYGDSAVEGNSAAFTWSTSFAQNSTLRKTLGGKGSVASASYRPADVLINSLSTNEKESLLKFSPTSDGIAANATARAPSPNVMPLISEKSPADAQNPQTLIKTVACNVANKDVYGDSAVEGNSAAFTWSSSFAQNSTHRKILGGKGSVASASYRHADFLINSLSTNEKESLLKFSPTSDGIAANATARAPSPNVMPLISEKSSADAQNPQTLIKTVACNVASKDVYGDSAVEGNSAFTWSTSFAQNSTLRKTLGGKGSVASASYRHADFLINSLSTNEKERLVKFSPTSDGIAANATARAPSPNVMPLISEKSSADAQNPQTLIKTVACNVASKDVYGDSAVEGNSAAFTWSTSFAQNSTLRKTLGGKGSVASASYRPADVLINSLSTNEKESLLSPTSDGIAANATARAPSPNVMPLISEKSSADAQNPQTLIKTVACNVANKDVYGDSAVEGNSAAFTWSTSFAQNSTLRKTLGGKGSVASASYRPADVLISSLSTNEKESLLKFSPTSDGIAANATARAPSPNVMPLTLIKTVACNVASKDVYGDSAVEGNSAAFSWSKSFAQNSTLRKTLGGKGSVASASYRPADVLISSLSTNEKESLLKFSPTSDGIAANATARAPSPNVMPLISEKSSADAQNPQTLIKTVACNVASKDVYGDSAVEGNSAAFTWSTSFAQNSTLRKTLGGKGSVASASYRPADVLINSLSTNEKESLLSPTSDGIAANATARAPSPNVMPLTLIKTVACNVASKDVYGDSAVEGNSAAFTWSTSFAQNSTLRKTLGGKGSVASASYRPADVLINSLSTNEKESLLKFSPTSDGIAANATARAPSPNVMPLSPIEEWLPPCSNQSQIQLSQPSLEVVRSSNTNFNAKKPRNGIAKTQTLVSAVASKGSLALITKNNGCIQLCLQDNIKIHMTLNKTIRVQWQNDGKILAIALSNAGFKTAVTHTNGRVLQTGDSIHIVAHDRTGQNKNIYNAKMYNDVIAFNSNTCRFPYSIDSTGMKEDRKEKFGDLTADITLSLFEHDVAKQPNIMMKEVSQVVTKSTYIQTPNGKDIYKVNGFFIQHSARTGVCITHKGFSIQLNPINESLDLKTEKIHCKTSSADFYVRHKKKRILHSHYNESKFEVINGIHKAVSQKDIFLAVPHVDYSSEEESYYCKMGL